MAAVRDSSEAHRISEVKKPSMTPKIHKSWSWHIRISLNDRRVRGLVIRNISCLIATTHSVMAQRRIQTPQGCCNCEILWKEFKTCWCPQAQKRCHFWTKSFFPSRLLSTRGSCILTQARHQSLWSLPSFPRPQTLTMCYLLHCLHILLNLTSPGDRIPPMHKPKPAQFVLLC